MVADVLVTQGARASATMILTLLNQDNSVPARWGLKQGWVIASSVDLITTIAPDAVVV